MNARTSPDMPQVAPHDAERYRRAGWWRDTTFLDDLRRGVDTHPDKLAVVMYRAETDTKHTLTYAELWRHTQRVAAALHQLGVRPGDMIAMQFPNRWEIAPVLFGAMQAGAVVSSYTSPYRRHELEMVMALSEPTVMLGSSVIEGDALGPTLVDLRDEVPSVRELFLSGPSVDGAGDFDEFFIDTPWEERGTVPQQPAAADDPFLILFTSGTTGESKASVHTLNTLHAAIRGEADAYGLGAELVMTTAAAYTHYTGIVQGIFMPIMVGGTMVFSDTFDGTTLLRLMAEYGTTFVYGAPSSVRNMLDVQPELGLDLSALQHFVTGSAPVPPHFIDEARATFGVQLHALWGMTENGPVTMTRPDDPPDWAAHSDGRAVADTELRIAPLTDQSDEPGTEGALEVAATGEGQDGIGRLLLRGPTQCLGYYKRADDYAALLDADGFFDTGDLARDDGRGGIRISGRASELIFSHAVRIPVTHLEAMISAHPAVREAALIGVPDGRGDEAIHAFVAPAGSEPFGFDELTALFTEQDVMKFYWPAEVHVVDQLPRTLTGKIRRNILKEELTS